MMCVLARYNLTYYENTGMAASIYDKHDKELTREMMVSVVDGDEIAKAKFHKYSPSLESKPPYLFIMLTRDVYVIERLELPYQNGCLKRKPRINSRATCRHRCEL